MQINYPYLSMSNPNKETVHCEAVAMAEYPQTGGDDTIS